MPGRALQPRERSGRCRTRRATDPLCPSRGRSCRQLALMRQPMAAAGARPSTYQVQQELSPRRCGTSTDPAAPPSDPCVSRGTLQLSGTIRMPEAHRRRSRPGYRSLSRAGARHMGPEQVRVRRSPAQPASQSDAAPPSRRKGSNHRARPRIILSSTSGPRPSTAHTQRPVHSPTIPPVARGPYTRARRSRAFPHSPVRSATRASRHAHLAVSTRPRASPGTPSTGVTHTCGLRGGKRDGSRTGPTICVARRRLDPPRGKALSENRSQ